MRLIGSARSILRRSTRTFRVRQISSTMSVGVTEPKSAPVGPAFTSKRSTVLPRSSAISRACSSVRASCRARSVSRLRSSPTRAGVAASASRRGRRKLRAYPRATSTTSPRRPTLSTSLSRITSTPASPRGGDVREKRHLARALDCDRYLPLVAAAGAGGGGHERRLASAAGLAAAEDLDAVGDDLAGLSLRTVLRVPLAPVEAAVDPHRPALGEELRAALALVAPDRDVEVVRLVAPLARRLVLLARVHGDAELADRRAARRVPQLGIACEISDENDSVDVRHLFPFSLADARDRAYSASWTGAGRELACDPGTCRTAMCLMTPSVILRTREISSTVSRAESNVSRWETPSPLWSI